MWHSGYIVCYFCFSNEIWVSPLPNMLAPKKPCSELSINTCTCIYNKFNKYNGKSARNILKTSITITVYFYLNTTIGSLMDNTKAQSKGTVKDMKQMQN